MGLVHQPRWELTTFDGYAARQALHGHQVSSVNLPRQPTEMRTDS
jgi:hypothetical protein